MFEQNGTALLDQEPRCDVVAAEDCAILFLDMNKPMTACPKGSAYHRSFVQNLLRFSAQYNPALSARVMHIALKAIQERLLRRLSGQANESMRNEQQQKTSD